MLVDHAKHTRVAGDLEAGKRTDQRPVSKSKEAALFEAHGF